LPTTLEGGVFQERNHVVDVGVAPGGTRLFAQCHWLVGDISAPPVTASGGPQLGKSAGPQRGNPAIYSMGQKQALDEVRKFSIGTRRDTQPEHLWQRVSEIVIQRAVNVR
jgi:hypothetical protein